MRRGDQLLPELAPDASTKASSDGGASGGSFARKGRGDERSRGGTVAVPEWWADEQYCYLTTKGRVRGRPHEIEIWFEVHEGLLYMVSSGGELVDWVKNLRADPGVKIRVVEDDGDRPARHVLAAKCQGWREG